MTTNPQTISPVEFDFDNRTLQLLDIRNMNLDALNGGVVPFHFSEVVVDVLLNGATPDSFDLTRGGDAVGLTFEPSGPANITGNAFQLPVVMTLDEVQATHVLDESVQIKTNEFTTRRNMTMTGADCRQSCRNSSWSWNPRIRPDGCRGVVACRVGPPWKAAGLTVLCPASRHRAPAPTELVSAERMILHYSDALPFSAPHRAGHP